MTVESKAQTEHPARILGWDAAGIVEAVGPECTLFKPGDQVYYAGDITRSGSNSEYQLVDERIVGRKPARLDFAEAAALPLTTLTAWEGLFDRLGISQQQEHNQPQRDECAERWLDHVDLVDRSGSRTSARRRDCCN